MRPRTALCALGTALALLTASSAAASPVAPLGHSGRWITDADGRVVILHGVNMVYKRPPYYPSATGFGDDDARFLQRNGFNSVRLGLIYKGVEPSPGAYDDSYLNQIAATEADLARHGVFSQLDFHQDLYNERFQGEGWPDWAVQDDGLPNSPQLGFPNNYFGMPALIRAFDHFWANDPGPGGIGLQDRYSAAWAHVASRFISARHTVGFDLINEPWPGTPWPSCFMLSGCPAFDTATMDPFYLRVIAQIRKVERQKLLWYEPNVLFNFGANTNIPALGDGAMGFSFHVYCTPGVAVVPYNTASCDGQEEHVLENADARAQATGNALMMSEFGATDDLNTIRRNVAEADRHMVSWQYWHYCGCADPTTSGPGIQALVLDPSRPPSGDNVKWAKLDVLAEPYPQVVAGTPRAFGFDPSTRAFHLTYSTSPPGGRRLAASSRKRARRQSRLTEIFIGRPNYPHGYRATVRGGTIASKPGARTLKVIACQRKRSVSVAVLPTTRRSGGHSSCRGAARPR